MLGFDLLRPEALLWALLAPAIALFGLYALRARERALARCVAPRQRARFLGSLAGGRASTRLVLAASGAFLLAMGLCGPVRGYTVREVKRRGLDLVVCIDVSRSMLVRDLRPDRMSRAKREVSGLLDHLRGDRVALLAFAGDVREIAPLTHDRTTLKALIEEVRPGENAVGGTNIGAALERALALFDGRTGAHEAIVLLTDGEDLEGRGQAVARQAAERGIKIFVVGLGSPAGGKIPTRGADGAEAFVTDEEGAEVVSSLNDATLREIAELSGGDYLPAQASPTPLEDLYEHRVLRLEGRDIGGGQEWLPHDRFQWFGVLALGCILVESALRERRRLRGARRAAGVLLGALVLGAAPARAQEQVQGDGATQVVAPWAGTPRAALLELQARCAKTEYEQALAVGAALLARTDLSEPERAEVHFNLGVTREAAGERAGAQAEFERAATLAGPGKLRLDALYDAGTLELLAAEELRLEIPEVREKLGLPAPAAAAPGAPPGAVPGVVPEPQAPDALPAAKAAYGNARETLVRRLRADWRDENTRANLELVQRRLRELAEIEEQREKDEQQQDEEQQPNEEQQGEEQQDEDKQGEEQPQDQEPDEQPQDQPPQDQPPDEQEPKEQQPEPGEQEQAEPPQPEQPGEEPSEERVLSREEMQRLLDRLQEIEQEARELAARLRAQRRVPVRKDW